MSAIAARVHRRLSRASKSALQSLGFFRIGQPKALAVVGCQRSGTTMLLDAFARDRRSRVYYEWDARLFQPSLRLKGADVVARRLQRDRKHLVVTKPLLDSQWTDEFLRAHPQAHAIWIYRHYSAVAKSNLRVFGRANGRRNLAPVLEPKNDYCNGDWRNERIASDTRRTIRSLAGRDCSDEDAAALFWFARNAHYFDHGLDRHPRVWLCNYEDIVQGPAGSLYAIYDAIGIPRPPPGVAAGIHQDAGQGSELRLSESVEAVCRDLWMRLEGVRRSKASSSLAHGDSDGDPRHDHFRSPTWSRSTG